MKVAYVIPFDLGRTRGLTARLRERLEEWVDLGVDVDLLVCVAKGSDCASSLADFPVRVHVLSGASSATATWGLAPRIRALGSDVIYQRYGLPYPGLIRAARALPTVLEIHADDLAESAHRRPAYRWTALALGGQLFRACAGAVFVDPDLVAAERYLPIAGPRASIPNGVRLRHDVPYGAPRDRKPGPPRLVLAVGAQEAWQGVDKLSQLATLLPDLEFHLVGGTRQQAPGPPNLHIHTHLEPPAFDRFLEGMDVGVGNLALERIGRRRPSPLKVRDYVRAGLPCVIAHDDPDLGAARDVLNLGYGFVPGPQSAAQLSRFAAEVTGRRVGADVALAVSLADKEVRRLQLLRSLAAEGALHA